MSDMSQGPGWWQASDDKWYPPDAAPASAPPPPPVNRTEYCTSCGTVMAPSAASCPSCGIPRLVDTRFCWNCASSMEPGTPLCRRCGAGLHGAAARGGTNEAIESKRIVAGVLAILVGALGIHKFYLGDTNQGLLRIGISLVGGVVTLGIALAAMSVIGIVEGIIYLTMSDADFIRTYQVGDKSWF